MATIIQFLENYNNYNLLSKVTDPPQYADSGGDPGAQITYYNFFQSYYLIVTTISTVGFGCPFGSVEGRIFIVIFFGAIVVVIPDMSSRLIDLLNSKSKYARTDYANYNSINIEHIVLIGTVPNTSLKNFLDEYFHPDHGDRTRHCVLMMPTRPDTSTELILMKPQYISTLYYIEGSTIDKKDLKRCLVEKARAVIILNDKFSFDAE